MKGRKQKKSEDTRLQRDRAELEWYAGGQTYIWITENNITNADQPSNGMLEQILSPTNLNQAYKRVKSNKGSGGVDKMEVESLLDYLVHHKEELIQSIMEGIYRPNPVRRVEIPKENGKMRMLGIPTVVDRVVQQAITQVLSPIYEKQFSPNSYGFRPKRSAHQALTQCKDHITDGYKYAVDMDLEKFFDTVNQSKLIEILSRTIKDGRVISLIHKYLNAGVVVRNKFENTEVGVPQGGPLSPLLSNIMLNELDKELEKRGHRFARYADDLVILCKSKRSAERTLTSIIPYIEEKLFLKVNREKTVVAYILNIKFLGYSFYENGEGGRLRIHPKIITKMKERIKELTSRSNGWGDAIRKEKLKQYITGWVNYFKLADMKSLLLQVDEWYRRRLRMVIWKQWKRIRTRLRNLIKLGIAKYKAWEYTNTRKGFWRTANSPILTRSITNDRLQQAGYIFFTDYFRKANGVN
ncbi:MAG: group II intron reverse transcriptase/maturase [Bacteroidota bacterium]|nr:group II intron reverse transcriptase/maturase [Odoribacter sp.]MDP3642473.1 group II intron reverse transcriptase/maturase [Bacteroidota bacterium]